MDHNINLDKNFIQELQDRDDRIRRLEVDGTKWIISASDPYGFWTIKSQSGGPTPEVLRGTFTGIEQAKNAVIGYIKAKKKAAENKAERIEAAIYKKPRSQMNKEVAE
jgi:hypothetical protein